MRKLLSIFIFLVLMTSVFLAAGCSGPGGTGTPSPVSPTASTTLPPVTPTPTPTKSPVDVPAFELLRVIWDTGHIYLLGTVDLPDGTRLYAQLYKDGQPADWWHSENRAFVRDGKWEAGLKSFQWNAPAILPDFESGYTLRLYDLHNPDIDVTLTLPYPGPVLTPVTELKDSRWKLVSLNGEELIDGTSVTANFDIINKGYIQGKNTINSYGGKYLTDAPDNLIIYDMATTLIGGPDNLVQQEVAYLNCLRNAASFRIADDRLEIFDDLGVRTLVFERVYK